MTPHLNGPLASRVLPALLALSVCMFAPAMARAQGGLQIQDDDDDLDWGVGFVAGAEVAEAFLANGDAVCREAEDELAGFGALTTCESETTVEAWGLDAGVTVGRFVAAKIGYLDIGRVDFDVTGVGSGIAGTASGRFGRARGVAFTVAGRFDVGWFVPFVEGGVWRWTAPIGASATIATTPPLTFSESGDVDSWDPVWAAGAEFWFFRNAGVTVGFRNVRLQTDDTIDLTGSAMDETFRMVFVGLRIGNR